MQNADDPASRVEVQLRPHIHLVSSFEIEKSCDPFTATKSQLVQLLRDAAKAKTDQTDNKSDAKDTAATTTTQSKTSSWCWKMLIPPSDRTAMVVWQSPMQLQGRQFPSDGYMWAQPESATIETVDGFKLETQKHSSGFVPGLEQYTLHARTRYRLHPLNAPPQGQGHQQQGCDPNLWLVLYHRASQPHIIHTSRIPPGNLAAQRTAYAQRSLILQNGGLLKQKQFVWNDRSKWPEVKLPTTPAETHTRPQQAPNVIGRGHQGGQYASGQQVIDPRNGQPAAKRLKQGAGVPVPQYLEGEDDMGNWDIMDLLTPREISRTRFKQHHEWMEELFSSPYAADQIIPVGLSLGRTGPLAGLSKGIAVLEQDTSLEVGDATAAKKMTSEDYNEAIKRANEYIAKTHAEMDKETARHQRRMARIRQSKQLQDAEKQLRRAVQLPTSTGTGSASSRMEAAPDGAPNPMDEDAAMLRQVDGITTIGQGIEKALDKRIEVIELAKCIDKGGLEEKAPTPAAPLPQDIDMDGMDETLQSDLQGIPDTGFDSIVIPAEGAAQALPQAGTGLQVEDFEMVDKSEVPAVLTGQAPPNAAEDALRASSGELGEDFLNLPDDGAGGGDGFDTSLFDDAMPVGDDMNTAGDAMEGFDAFVEAGTPGGTAPNTIDMAAQGGTLSGGM